MIQSTLETFQKLDSKSRLLGDLKHSFANIRFSDNTTDKKQLELAFNQVMVAEKLIKAMYDDLAEGQAKIYSNPSQQAGCGGE